MSMKNNLLSLGVVFLFSSLFIACSDENMNYGMAESQVLDSNQDLTYGTNVFISGIDSLTDQRIPLNTNSPVEVTNHNGIVSFDCVSENGKYYLRPKMLKPLDETTILDKVTLRLPGDNKPGKDILVSVRKNSPLMARAQEPTDEEKRFSEVFSYGIFPSYDIGEVISRYPALDKKIVAEKVQIIDAFIPSVTQISSQGNTLEEANKSWGISVGLDNIPLPSGVGKASASLGYQSENKKKSSYQYAMRTKNYEAAAGSVNWYMVDDNERYKYISADLNKILNTGEYSKELYDTTEMGTFKILDEFGPYVPSWCLLGARATYTLSKKQDLEMRSSKWEGQVKAMLSNTKGIDKDSILGMSKDQLSAFKSISEGAPSASVSFNYKNEEVAEQSDLKINLKLLGGNSLSVKEFDEFQAGKDPKAWIPLAYSGYGQPADLYPLYNFVADKKSKRYQLLKKYIDGDSASIAAYYKHRNELYDQPEKTRWVLAGLKMVVTENENPAPFMDKCPDGVERVFYPMMINRTIKKDGRLKDTGKALDTETGDFGKAVRYRYHFWYYALALHSECPGIKSIRFADKNDIKDNEVPCMKSDKENADIDTGTGWSCTVKQKTKLVVTPIAKNDKESKPITAFALGDKNGNIYASTGGTEYGFDPQSTDSFHDFWVDKKYEKYRSGMKAPTPYGIYYLYGIIQPYKLYFCYSTKPLDLLDDINKGYQIEHPTNMGRGNF